MSPGPDAGDDQPERTTLAWARTALAATAASAVLGRFAMLEGSVTVAVSAGLAGLLALTGFLEGVAGHARRRRWFEHRRVDRALPLAARLTVLATAGLALAGALLVLV